MFSKRWKRARLVVNKRGLNLRVLYTLHAGHRREMQSDGDDISLTENMVSEKRYQPKRDAIKTVVERITTRVLSESWLHRPTKRMIMAWSTTGAMLV